MSWYPPNGSTVLKKYSDLIIKNDTGEIINDKFFSKYDTNDYKRGYLVSIKSQLEFEEKKSEINRSDFVKYSDILQENISKLRSQ